MPGDVVARLTAHPWPPLQRLLLQTILSTGAAFTDTRDLADRLYAGRADGGPDYAVSSIKVHVYNIRRVLAVLAPEVRIASKVQHGYRLEVAG